MRTVSAFIANHVEVRDSMLYVSGGFPEWWKVPMLPIAMPIGVGLVVEVEPGELGEQQSVKAVLRHVDGPDIGTAEMSFTRQEDPEHIENSPYYMPIGMTFIAQWTQAGPDEVVVSSDDLVMEIVRFGLRTPAAS